MSTMSPSHYSGHIIGVVAPLWGHSKPLSALASKIVQERSDILITLLVVGDYVTRATLEIDRYFPEHSGGSPRGNIRVISIGEGSPDPLSIFSVIVNNFGTIYTKLANKQPVVCSTGKSYDTPVIPSVAIVDFFFPEVILDIRKASDNGPHVTVLVWNSGNGGATLRVLGPEKYGGFGDVENKARELALATGRDVVELENELYYPTAGAILSIPGLPPIFDYELSPQATPIKDFQRELFKKCYRFMTLCDGMIAATSAAFEPEAHTAWEAFLSETNRSYYVLGPLQPQGLERGTLADSTKENDLNNSQNGRELLEFLDNTLQTKGSNCLIYISWGSFFWPKDDHVWKLIDVLLELKFPFILAHASPLAIIPAELSARVEASGIGMLSSWTPQQLVLAHPATGWFLTHCGQNGVTEAISQGVPMIAWPVDADQPINAARLSTTLDVAFELMEVRTGNGLKPLYRGVTPKGTIEAVESEFYEVLKNARGPAGDRKRRNAHALRDATMDAWSDEGPATKALKKLLNDNFP